MSTELIERLRRIAKRDTCNSPDSVTEAADEIERLLDSERFYRRRCEALQEWQSKMRDPERTIVCDILANGTTLHPDYSGDRYKVPPNVEITGGQKRSFCPSSDQRERG